MIITNHGNKMLCFGEGDISIGVAKVQNMENFYSSILFKEIEPIEIGAVPPKTVDTKEIDTALIFTETKSIDVLIKGLEEAKKNMLEGQKRNSLGKCPDCDRHTLTPIKEVAGEYQLLCICGFSTELCDTKKKAIYEWNNTKKRGNTAC